MYYGDPERKNNYLSVLSPRAFLSKNQIIMEKLSMDVIHCKAAGIDAGSRSHFVTIGQQSDQVKEFGVYTNDHNSMIKWLKDSGITTIIPPIFSTAF